MKENNMTHDFFNKFSFKSFSSQLFKKWLCTSCVCICVYVCIISVLERLWDIVLCWWDETRVVQDCMRRIVHWLYFPEYFVTSSSYSDLQIIVTMMMVVIFQFFMKIVWLIVLEVMTLVLQVVTFHRNILTTSSGWKEQGLS